MGNCIGGSTKELAQVAYHAKLQRDTKRRRAIIPLQEVAHALRERILEINSASELLLSMHDTNNPITCTTVMIVSCDRARRVGEALGTNAEELFEEAIEAARKADQRIREGTARPLEGLPISIKDVINMKGCLSTCGLAAKARDESRAEEDAVLIKIMTDLGAIPFVRGNVPQSLMLPETDNNVWGRACNPWSPDRVPGGSSGGDAAIVAARVATLAIGTDIGGSVRIPANWCGIVGFKPTAKRLSGIGVLSARRAGIDFQEAVLATAGPLVRDVKDAVLFMRLCCQAHVFAMDPANITPKVWDQDEYQTILDRAYSQSHPVSVSSLNETTASMHQVTLSETSTSHIDKHHTSTETTSMNQENDQENINDSNSSMATHEQSENSSKQNKDTQQTQETQQAQETPNKLQANDGNKSDKTEHENVNKAGCDLDQDTDGANIPDIVKSDGARDTTTNNSESIQENTLNAASAAIQPINEQTNARALSMTELAHSHTKNATNKTLVIGYYDTDDFFEASVSCKRAVHEAVEALKKLPNVKLVPFKPNNTHELAICYYALLASEGKMKAFKDGLEGEKFHPMYSELVRLSSLPDFMRPVIAKILRASGEPRVADMLLAAKAKSTWQYWNILQRRRSLIATLVKEWSQYELDAVICPATGLPAIPHGTSGRLTPSVSYTFLWNVTNFPAGVVPVTSVQDIHEEQVYNPPKRQQDRVAKEAHKAISLSAGCPIGVQVVGLPNHDETTLAVMQLLQDVLPDKPHQKSPDITKYIGESGNATYEN